MLFVIQSNLLQTSLPVIAATAQRMGVPAINTLDTPVRNHSFLAAHAMSYERMGAAAGQADAAAHALRTTRRGRVVLGDQRTG